jgi:hypothetical protein
MTIDILHTVDDARTFDDEDSYRSFRAMNWSRLKLMRDVSARTLRHELLNGPSFKGNAATRFGSLCHTVALEPHEVLTRYRLAVETNKRTKAYRQEVAEAEADGAELVTNDDMVKSQRMALAYHAGIEALSGVYGWMKRTATELGIAANVQAGGNPVAMKGKLDDLYEHDEGLLVVDYKTTSSPLASRSLQTIIGQRGYHLQGALYRKLLRALWPNHADTPIDLAWVFVHTDAPHEVVSVIASDEMSAAADHDLDALLARYHHCLTHDVWPGLPPVATLDLLPWHAPSTADKPVDSPSPLPF